MYSLRFHSAAIFFHNLSGAAQEIEIIKDYVILHAMNLYFYSLISISIHLEVASDTFCLLINSSWLLVFAIILISFLFTGFNLYCWTGIHFS